MSDGELVVAGIYLHMLLSPLEVVEPGGMSGRRTAGYGLGHYLLEVS